LFFWDKYWGTRPIEVLFHHIVVPEDCEITTDRGRLAEASAVVFHVPELATLDGIPRFPGQIWVGWSVECQAHRPWQDFLNQFDLTMTYKSDADVFAPYLPTDLDDLRRPPRPKPYGNLVSFLASNWREYSGRTPYAIRLMRHLPVHSYGKVLNNRKIFNDWGYETKSAIIAGYRFNLAIENAIDPDYVTEKFYHPLIAGTVPVYLGAPNIDDFAPGEHCYIDIRDFKNPKELAHYLLYLEQDEDAYARYLDWGKNLFGNPF